MLKDLQGHQDQTTEVVITEEEIIEDSSEYARVLNYSSILYNF